MYELIEELSRLRLGEKEAIVKKTSLTNFLNKLKDAVRANDAKNLACSEQAKAIMNLSSMGFSADMEIQQMIIDLEKEIAKDAK